MADSTSQLAQLSPRTVPIIKNPRMGLRFNLLNMGMTALVTISMIRVSSLAPGQDREEGSMSQFQSSDNG